MIHVDSLIIEVTRRCNMQCEHCLRGDAQNLDVSHEVLEFIAKTIKPGTVTFSGGEPSLNVPAIEEYFRLAEKYGTMPSSFYVATNGATSDEQMKNLALTLLEAYPKMDEPDMCEVNVSVDMFHEAWKEADHSAILRGLAFFRVNGKRHSLTDDDMSWLISVGRAAENGIGARDGWDLDTSMESLVQDIYVMGGETHVHFDTLYVSANGNVVSNCDSSYDDIDDKENVICHISELRNVVKAYAGEEQATA